MCGILGILAAGPLRVDSRTLEAMRDTLAHRGPDSAGLWLGDGMALAHRRLAIIDPTPAGAQPMFTPDGRCGLVYNGELYNDAEVRTALAREGVTFRTASDTETVLRAIERWGSDAFPRLRGMYALGFLDVRARVLLLARDPMGVKPLYFARLGDELVFASEIPAILRHPDARAAPDWACVSAYLTTIRTTLDERTMYEGVRCVRPGEVLRCAVDDGLRLDTIRDGWVFEAEGSDRRDARPTRSGGDPADLQAATIERTREVVRGSVAAQLRSDVPVCVLLSGGLDSSIIAASARGGLDALWTYCAGHAGGDGASEDFGFARRVAAAVGSNHSEAPISREDFIERWAWMVDRLGVPMSTPNETAIHEVARRLRADGKVVALSGEGADELFGGYGPPMRMAAEFERRHPNASVADRAGFQIDSNAWMPREAKERLLTPGFREAADRDRPLAEAYQRMMDRCTQSPGPGGALQIHLRFHRRVNLIGLLQRLDTATMLAGVEGRVPFADERVAALAESLPMELKCIDGMEGGTKVALRLAFAGDLPDEVVRRPKASFPLPFQGWLASASGLIAGSAFLREMFTAEAIRAVAQDPAGVWTLAWPMANLALWGQRFENHSSPAGAASNA